MATLLSVMTGSGESRLMSLSVWLLVSPWCTLAPKVLASGVTMVYSGSKGAGFWCHNGVLWLQRCWLLVSQWCTLAPKVLAFGVTMVYSGSKDVGRLKLALHWYASSLKTNNESDCSPLCHSLYVLYNYMDGLTSLYVLYNYMDGWID